MIDSYSFGSITIKGKTYTQDLIIFPDKIKTNWWRKEGHSLALGDLDEVIVYKPEVLIVGKGASSCMEVSPATKNALEKQNIELIAEDTDSACKVFNDLLKKGKKTVGAFHLTC